MLILSQNDVISYKIIYLTNGAPYFTAYIIYQIWVCFTTWQFSFVYVIAINSAYRYLPQY